MKTIGIIALMAFVMAVSVIGVSTAPTFVDVHGTIIQMDGQTPAGAGIMVDVQCDSDGTITTKSSETDSQSEYVVEFDSTECIEGDMLTASVAGDEASRAVKSKDMVLPDLYVVNLELSIPEFSVLAAGVAFAGAGLGYMFMRKRR